MLMSGKPVPVDDICGNETLYWCPHCLDEGEWKSFDVIEADVPIIVDDSE